MYQDRALCERRALAELDGLGDAAAGEWREWEPRRYFHIRRRMQAWESAGMRLRDIRGTREARLRVERIPEHRLAVVPPFLMRRELGLY